MLTYVVVLQKAVEGRQVLNYELAQDPLVSLDAQQGGGEVGGRKEILNQGTHHPQYVLLFQKKQQTWNHLEDWEKEQKWDN